MKAYSRLYVQLYFINKNGFWQREIIVCKINAIRGWGIETV